MSSPTRIVICGGGAIGAATAYFASRRGAHVTVIERHAVAGAASGKSGGFLALDWCRGSALDELARRSFRLHAELSAELGDPWGYRRLTTYAGDAAADDAGRGAPGRPWLAEGVAITSRLGTPDTTALVEPRAFTTGLMRAAEANGAVLRHAAVIDVVRDGSGAARGVALAEGEIVEGDAVVIAMGPNTVRRAAKFSPLSCFPASTARRGCVRSRRWARCRSILPTLRPMRVRTRGSKRCAGTSRPRSPPRRSKRGKRVSGL
jgi:glycine/D-amino acid oxidase-like deaminating enzyme